MTRLLLAALLLCATAPVLAQTAEDLSTKVDSTIATEANTQQLKNTWATEKSSLDERYRAAKANVTWLNERLKVEQQRASALDDAVRELERRQTESARLQAVVQDSMVAVLYRLERAVAADLPFLASEREQRLAFLRAELAKPEVESGEKLRRLLEGLLVEAQYGGTVEVTQERITIEGTEKVVDMLRLGRLALFWRTPDGAQIGTWDPVTATHVLLPGKYSRTIQKAMEMATRIRPVQLLSLPLGRIQP
jgi:hypothetical protein